jgi:hypothetical protein
VAHKARYTPPTKKKKSASAQVPVPPQNQAVDRASAPVALPLSTARPPAGSARPVRAGTATSSIPPAMKYAGLPRELGWLGLLSLVTISLLFILWLIFK